MLDALYVYNTDFQLVSVIDSWRSLIWTDRYNKYGDFQMELDPSIENLENLNLDYYVINPESEHFMIIEEIYISSDADTGRTLKVTGRSGESIISRRIIWKTQSWSDVPLCECVHRLIRDNITHPEWFSSETYPREISNFKFIGPSDAIRSTDNSIEPGNYYDWGIDSGNYYYTKDFIPLETDHVFWAQCGHIKENQKPRVVTFDANYNFKTIEYPFTWDSGTSGSWFCRIHDADIKYVQLGVPKATFESGDCSFSILHDTRDHEKRGYLLMPITQEFTGDNAYDVLTKLCESNNCGFKVTLDLDRKVFNFQLYCGWDRSFPNDHRNPVIFSEDFDNLISTEWSRDYTQKITAILAGGQSDTEINGTKYVREWRTESNRGTTLVTAYPYVDHDNRQSTGTWGTLDGLYRREMYSDQSGLNREYESSLTSFQISQCVALHNAGLDNDTIAAQLGITTSAVSSAINGDPDPKTTKVYDATTYRSLLGLKARADYAEVASPDAITGQMESTGSFSYEIDYRLGDWVTYQDPYGHNQYARVTEWIYSSDTSGVSCYPTIVVGDYTLDDALSKTYVDPLNCVVFTDAYGDPSFAGANLLTALWSRGANVTQYDFMNGAGFNAEYGQFSWVQRLRAQAMPSEAVGQVWVIGGYCDIFYGDMNTIKTNCRQFCEEAHKKFPNATIKLAFAGHAPSWASGIDWTEYNKRYTWARSAWEEVANEYDYVKYVQKADQILGDSDFMGDAINPNAQGVARLADSLAPTMYNNTDYAYLNPVVVDPANCIIFTDSYGIPEMCGDNLLQRLYEAGAKITQFEPINGGGFNAATGVYSFVEKSKNLGFNENIGQVWVMWGLCDILYTTDFGTLKNNMRAFIKNVKQMNPNAAVKLCLDGHYPSWADAADWSLYDTMYQWLKNAVQEVANEYDYAYYVEGAPRILRDSDFMPDGINPNAQGISKLVSALAPAMINNTAKIAWPDQEVDLTKVVWLSDSYGDNRCCEISIEPELEARGANVSQYFVHPGAGFNDRSGTYSWFLDMKQQFNDDPSVGQVWIFSGYNDINNGTQEAIKETMRDFMGMTHQKFPNAIIKLCFVGQSPPWCPYITSWTNWLWLLDRIHQTYRSIANEYDYVWYIENAENLLDLNTDFYNAGVNPAWVPDGIHPGATGTRRMADKMAPAMIYHRNYL